MATLILDALARTTRAFIWVSRPQTWLTTMVPAWVGHLLASGSLWPPAALWMLLLAVGPLHWLSSLLLNDVFDLPGDRHNPRKAAAPLVRGDLRPRSAVIVAVLAGIGAVGLVVPLGLWPTVFVAATMAMAIAYNVPPLRWKGRPGLDVLSNALRIGVLSSLAGWSVVAPLASFPWPFLFQGFLVAVAVYVPTMLMDLEADREAGLHTIATRLGRRAYWVGAVAWFAACAGAVALAVANEVIPRGMLPVVAIAAPVLAIEYHALIGRARTSLALARGILVCSVSFLAVSIPFALALAGIWRP